MIPQPRDWRSVADQPMSESLHDEPIPHSSPYCYDPNCKYCKELREVQESIRLHEASPKGIPK